MQYVALLLVTASSTSQQEEEEDGLSQSVNFPETKQFMGGGRGLTDWIPTRTQLGVLVVLVVLVGRLGSHDMAAALIDVIS
eukprot:COSAG06_NODE_727_length_12752_cov_61.232277_8_plen_81_part_00